MQNLINQPVYESKNSDKVVQFLDENQLKAEIVEAIENNTIEALYYDQLGNVMALDIWQDTHEDILIS